MTLWPLEFSNLFGSNSDHKHPPKKVPNERQNLARCNLKSSWNWASQCRCAFFCASLFNPFWASPGPTFSTPLQIPPCIFLGLTKKLILATKFCNKGVEVASDSHTLLLKQKGSRISRPHRVRLRPMGRSITQSRRTEMPRKRRCRHLPVSRFNVQDEQNRCRWEDVLD
jgi:hypothetical protein